MLKRILQNTTDKYASRWLVLAIDLVLVVQTFVLAYLIRFNFSLDFNVKDFFIQQPIVILVALVSFLIVGSYKGVVRHTGVKDAMNVMFAVSLVAFLLIIMVILNNTINIYSGFTIPFSIITIHYLLNLVLLIASRFVFKITYRKLMSEIRPQTNILIYGAGDSGFITHSAIVKDTKNSINVIGFIDDNPTKQGKKIDGLMIYPSKVLTREFVLRNRIKEVIVSIQNVQPNRLMQITDDLIAYNVKVKIVPAIDKWIDGQLNIGQIKPVKIEDLLERDTIEIDNPVIKRNLKNKTVLVTGAAGSIGSEIARQITRCNVKQLILVDQAESPLYDLQQEFVQIKQSNFSSEVADVRDYSRMQQIFNKYNPQYVFHAAAYKHVPLMEANPYEAIRVNISGTKLLADLSILYKVEKFVMVSTDKAVNPTNVMGTTKRIAEMYISSLAKNGTTKFITTRFGNVLGSNGSVIPLFKKQIEVGGPLTVTHKDITRYFMTIPEACQLVLEAGIMGNGGEIYVFDMGASIKIYDVAIKMIQLSGLKFPEDIDIEISGLRPGEKLYEELLANNENTQPTYHEKIMIAKVPSINTSEVKLKIEEICEVNLESDNFKVVSLLKELVPEYLSKNSIYEKLDKSNK
jgi:FlaA1/EpsC-like NDP-sugar epimerase